jgi:peptidoglycan-N-acetylglucosamine deacetylase
VFSLEAILTVAAIGVVLYHGVPALWMAAVRGRLNRKMARCNRLVLTFDDGPGRRLTPAVLDLLGERGVKATFFLLGRNVQQNEDLVRLIQAQGHEIGSHTFNHLHAWKVAPWHSVSDIRRGFQAIDEALGTRGGRYPFRPPYGKLNLATLLYLLARRIPIVYWTVDSGDTWSVRPEDSQAAHLSSAAGGGVVLAHDFDRETPGEIHQYVLNALRSTLDMAHEHDLQLSTFSQLRGVRA